LRDALVPIDGGEPAFDYSTLVEHAAQASAGAEGLFFLPHLMGERGPFEDPLARGALVGLTLRHKHEHMARAVLEGTVFQLRRILEAQAAAHPTEDPPTSGIASGGAARSPIWMQLIADVTGLTLRVPEVVETAAIGAAMLGAAAAGLLPLDLATVRMTHPGPVYAPDPASGREYEAAYARFRQLDDLLAPWFRESP
jgi:sugar (pentulose or hexulose) kinase